MHWPRAFKVNCQVTLTVATTHTTLDSKVTCISRLDNVLNACLVYCLVSICFLFVCYGEEVEDTLPNRKK